MFLAPLMNPGANEVLPVCPYLVSQDVGKLSADLMTVVGAYEVIRETLARHSIEGVPAQAEVLVRVYSDKNPKMASLAKRLVAEKDAESARRTFMRLNRLMEKDAYGKSTL